MISNGANVRQATDHAIAMVLRATDGHRASRRQSPENIGYEGPQQHIRLPQEIDDLGFAGKHSLKPEGKKSALI